MALCAPCASIKLDDFFTGAAIPWHCTSLALHDSARVQACELCDLFFSATYAKETKPSTEQAYYIAGSRAIDKDNIGETTPNGKLISVDLYAGVPDAPGLSKSGDARTRHVAFDAQGREILIFSDQRLKNRIANLAVLCDAGIQPRHPIELMRG